MTIVFVHGNPEVAAVWDPLLDELGRDDALALSPPGFGSPIPAGFGATAAEYAVWLTDELERLAAPVHLVGHDWGGGHVIAAATLRPKLVRTVTTDMAACFAPGYGWHDMAQVWRTPGDGEAAMEVMASLGTDDLADTLAGLGMTPEVARACAAVVPDMTRCILPLYRSADEDGLRALGESYAATDDRPPTHVIAATADHYTGGEELARRSAAAWNAQVHVIDGLGHWWMLQDPALGAAVIRDIVG